MQVADKNWAGLIELEATVREQRILERFRELLLEDDAGRVARLVPMIG